MAIVAFPLRTRCRVRWLGRANDTWKITEKLGGTVLDYIVWKIDSDNIAGDLTKEKEGPRKEAKDEIHPPRSSSLAKQVHTRERIRTVRGLLCDTDVASPCCWCSFSRGTSSCKFVP